MKFLYQARNREGQIKQGLVVAASPDKAERLLAENGLIIVELSQQAESFLERLKFLQGTVKSKDLVLFSRQLATLISARVPILQSLRILENQIDSKRLVGIIRALIASIENGESLSLALSKTPEVFGNIYVSLVRAGEVTGSLDKSFTYLADQLEKEYELRAKIKSALTYPVFVVASLLTVGLLMFKFVLPKLTDVLKQQGGQLPSVSVALIAATDFFNAYWWLVLLILIGLIVGARVYISTAAGRYQWDRIKIYLPIFGDIFKKIYLARFSRNLSTLIAGGIPIITAFKIIAEIINNVIYRDAIMHSVDEITNGKGISEALVSGKLYPPLVTQMIKVGEETAQLDGILAKLAVFYEKEVDNKVSTLTTLLEPLIMVVLGLGVGLLVAGVLLPIYNLASTAG